MRRAVLVAALLALTAPPASAATTVTAGFVVERTSIGRTFAVLGGPEGSAPRVTVGDGIRVSDTVPVVIGGGHRHGLRR